jgi:hypothetical protein
VLVGSTADDQEFTAVLCLARDVEVAAERIDAGLRRWAVLDGAALAAAALHDGGTASAAAAAASSSASAPASAAARKPAALSAGAKADAAARDTPERTARFLSASPLHDDPCQAAWAAGIGKVSYVPPPAALAEYESIIRDEAFGELTGLKAIHYAGSDAAKRYSGGGGYPVAGWSHGGGGGGAASSHGGTAGVSMKRHMQVSAEMSSLSSLAVNWGSSVLVRQDESK